jgi:hypothetical protein
MAIKKIKTGTTKTRGNIKRFKRLKGSKFESSRFETLTTNLNLPNIRKFAHQCPMH